MDASASRADRLSAGVSATSAFLVRHRVRLIALLLLVSWLVALFLYLEMPELLPLLLGLIPVALGCIVAVLQIPSLTHWINGSDAAICRVQTRGRENAGRVAKYVTLPATGGTLWLWRKSTPVRDDHARAAIRVTAFVYLWSAVLGIVAAAVLIMIWIAMVVLAIMLVLWVVSAAAGGRREEQTRSFSFFATECRKCGSREHATAECPHGFFSSECASCGSKNHATDQCPHGLFSSKCANCGSPEHASSACPHGLFSSECGSCGSKSHATKDCPHGLFSSACANCGSIDHATSHCPH